MILRMIIMVPIVQLLIIPLAADYEIKKINVVIVDQDRSSYSRDLINRITGSGYFVLQDYTHDSKKAMEYIESDEADLSLEIPKDFEKDIIREGKQSLYLNINAINGTKANVGGAYLSRIVTEYNIELQKSIMIKGGGLKIPKLEIATLNLYNPMLNYQIFMVPGILVILVSMIGAYMSALNIVKEKEVGTIEQINVTPIKKHLFILGKLIPFWIIGMFVFSLGLFLVGRLVYGIIPMGSLLLMYSYLALYLVAVLGVGLLLSTYSKTQQQAMSLAFFMMMIFILMGGLFTPLEGMPDWAMVLAKLNPVTYFIEVIRAIVMKGSEFHHIWKHFIIMLVFAIVFNTWAILNYRKTS